MSFCDCAPLECQAVVWRMGEIFGEFGVKLKNDELTNDELLVSKWELSVLTDSREQVLKEELGPRSFQKVVKLKPALAYLVQVRVHSSKYGAWSPWSDFVRTRTYAAVVTSISEIGEDYVRVQWDRPVRDTSLLTAEELPEAQHIVSGISQYELRVVREADMLQEFCDEFPTGVRTYTLHELRPGTAYIVFHRYATLIGTQKQWTEVCRFYTQSAHQLAVKKRAEDTVTLQWARALLPSSIGYLMPDSSIHKFELTLEGGEEMREPLELPSSTTEFRFADLTTSSSYRAYLRCLTKEGRWGSRTKPLQFRTADKLSCKQVACGETFASLTWIRPIEEEKETKFEYILRSVKSNYEHKAVEDIAEVKVVHLSSLSSGTEYTLQLRSFLDDEWGLWCEPFHFITVPKPSISFLERGEDFLTLSWTRNTDSQRFHLVVRCIEANESIVLDEEVESCGEEGFRINNLVADRKYEVKVRSWQYNRLSGYEGWGEFSLPIQAQTLQSVALQVLDIGENFCQLTWRRALTRSSGDGSKTSMNWVDLKYELVLGCIDSGEDNVLHKEVLDTTYTITSLAPGTTYVASVRACDEREQWGLWNKVEFKTIAPLHMKTHEIGEDFVRLMWRREIETVENFVSQYSLFIFSVAADERYEPNGYHRGGNSEVQITQLINSHHTSVRVGDLLPDRNYTAVIRAATASNKWGLWCPEVKFRTVSPFRIPANSLSIGENYVNLVWSRDEKPIVPANVVLGDYTIISQQLRVVGMDTQYSKDHTLPPDQRELKLPGLTPATAYSIQIRACNKSGEWGLWSAPVHILTRATISVRAVEVAENYLIVAWEKKKAANPHNYPTGKGYVTSYRLRVSNSRGVHSDTPLVDGDSPFTVTDLDPDTYYCVELKANYNGEEWGLWSTPLWCLTMKQLEVQAKLISEEFCDVMIVRPQQTHRLPEDDGNQATEDRVITFGQLRAHCLLCVTTPDVVPLPHMAGTLRSTTVSDPKIPPQVANERVIDQPEITEDKEEVVHRIQNLKCDTIYSVAVRAKLHGGEWGMWSAVQRFVTVPPIAVSFPAIGEDFISIDWKRSAQTVPTTVPRIASGGGVITKSKLKIKSMQGSFQNTIEIDSMDTRFMVKELTPATNYVVQVQTFNDNHTWGVWSDEAKVRTVPAMGIDIEHISEDAVWLSWMRKADTSEVGTETVLNVDTVVKAYELNILSDGHFYYQRELENHNCFFRGLIPDTVYEVRIRALSQAGTWGLWSSQLFRTQPTIRVTFGNIGEDFAVVEWRRHLPAAVKNVSNEIAECEGTVQEFRMKVERVGGEELTAAVYELSPFVSSFTLKKLQPSTEYRVWMCARGYEGVWGLWNQEARVRTLPQLGLHIEDIGENYVTVSWNRLQWDGATAPSDPNTHVWEIEGAVQEYHLTVLNEQNEEIESLTKKLSYQYKQFTLQHLSSNTVYSVVIKGKDTFYQWGLPSEPVQFATLQPVKVNLLKIGENFINLEWERRTRLRKLRIQPLAVVAAVAEPVEEVEEGEEEEEEEEAEEEVEEAAFEDTPSEAPSEDNFAGDILRGDEDVQQWHVQVRGNRLFGGQPGAEDFKEFFTERGVTSFAITNLLPSSSYLVAVRAKNMKNEWGEWSEKHSLQTMPLLLTTVDYVGEDFIVISWERPVINTELQHLHSFPPATAVHNYQVLIQPLDTEQPFSEQDEPLVDGARQYETSQPTIQLHNLSPGTRYKIVVREQMSGIDDNLSDYGMYSEAKIVETIEPMILHPEEIGENFATLSWNRKIRLADGNDDAVSVSKSCAKVVFYELKIVRLDDGAENPLKGSNAMQLSKTFPLGIHSFIVPSLMPNAIYGTYIRAQTEGDHWGLWSAPMKFVTQKRLTVHVELVNEDNFLVSWTRHFPDWVKDASAPFRSDDASSTHLSINEDGNEGEEELPGEAPPAETFSAIEVADYNVKLYELSVSGLGNDFSQSIVLPSSKITTRVAGVSHNQLYTVSIRSKSLHDNWSLWSPKVTLCTLKPMELTIGKHTENMVCASWNREPQSVADHHKLLNKCQLDVQREAEAKEKMARLQRQQKLQEQANLGNEASDFSRVPIERAADMIEEASYLYPENVCLGKAEVTGYHLRLFGDEGTPFISGSQHLLPVKKKRKKVTIRQPAVREGKKKRPLKPQPSEEVLPDDDDAPVDDERLLLDVRINSKTKLAAILGLVECQNYEICIRSRNIYNEWGPWSSRQQVRTLAPLNLCHSRFGEHYINLYWHRVAENAAAEHEKQVKTVKEYEEEYKDITPQDLERKKSEMSPDEHSKFIEKLKDWKTQQKAIQRWTSTLVEGGGEVCAGFNTPISGYHLRVIHENGQIQDSYFAEGGPGTHQYTVTGLSPNSMYVVMMCVDYGNGEWGSWSAPLKFMTQNLIQLSLTYVGESFIDIEWKRAPNKRPGRVDDGSILVNPTTQGRGHQYEVSVQFTENDEPVDERRAMKDCNVFRIEGLRTDCRYNVCVREWDPKGEWGLWSTYKSCVTLAGMRSVVEEIGEDWMNIRWERQPTTVRVDQDDPTLVQLPVDSMAYYLRVEELKDNGTQADLARLEEEAREAEVAEEAPQELQEPGLDSYIDLLQQHEDETTGPLPAHPPPEETCGNDTSGRYCFVKKFSYDVMEFRVANLKPDRYYNVQVMCETTGQQLGSWSSDVFALTLAKIKIRCDLIDEKFIRFSWQRDPPRQHSRLSQKPFVGSYFTQQYEVEAHGIEKWNEHYSFHQQFPKAVSECKLEGLGVNTAYCIRVRSKDMQQRESLWSDDLNVATLKPLKVLPSRITENAAQIRWGRDTQDPLTYPPTTTPLVFGQERANQYHLRVFATTDKEQPIVDKQFPGSVSKFNLSLLSPNTAYIIQVRSCNIIGEWGSWSDERVIYTMKLIALSTMAVGEDYIMINWARDAPDELQEMMQSDERRPNEESDDEQTFPPKKRYPLLDQPQEKNIVYTSAQSTVVRFAISVTKHEESEGWTTEIPSAQGKCSTYTISGLKPDSQYAIAIRASYGDEDWGLWSDPIDSGTLNLLHIDVKHVGEDFLTAAWQRAVNSFSVSEVQMGKPEETICYQFSVHDFTEVPIGEETSADLGSICVKDLWASSKNAVVKSLKPNRRYRLSVRRWYKPVTAVEQVLVEGETAALTEEQRLQRQIQRCSGVAGGWSDSIFVLTLKEMVIFAEDIAEDFLNLRWERDAAAPVLPTRQCVQVKVNVQSYHIRIDEMLTDASAVDNSQGTLHLDQQFGAEESAFRATDLKPDGVYKIDVRCCTDKVWGLWSKEYVVATLPKLQVTVGGIGEDYVSLSWDRKIRSLTLPDGRKVATGNATNVEKYQLEMYGLEHPFRLEKKFKASRTSYKVKRLEAQMLYSVMVRSCDSTNVWSLWSDRIVFATLKPMRLTFGKIGEQFAHVSWSRDPQSVEEYTHADSNVLLGSTKVISYHLCVFPMEQAPSTALVDRQFNGETHQFRIAGLNPNTSYIVILRACNDESQWGLWSEEKVITTLKLIQLQVVAMGENYVTMKWSREDAEFVETTALPLGQRVDPTMFHVCITSETENIDRHFTLEECAVEGDLPAYTVRNLNPDTRYIIALQCCYGNDEWGLWTKPLTFLTLNKLAISVGNISEEKADFTWGRAQQTPSHAYDPNVIVWLGTIVKYQLIVRKVDQMKAAEKKLEEQGTRAFPVENATEPGEKVVIPDQEEEPEQMEEAPICIERNMEVKQAKYVQTFCSVDQLSVNTDYHVQVRALDDKGEWGEWSEVVFDTPPSPPQAPSLKKSGAQHVLFSWEPPDPFSRYSYCVEQAVVKEVKKSSRPQSQPEHVEWRVVENVEDTSCRLRAFGPLNKIRCRVKCCKLDRPTHLFSKYSPVAALASVAPPEPVSNLQVTTLSRTTATLEWAKAQGDPTRPDTPTGDFAPQPPSRVAYRVLLAAREQQPTLMASTRSSEYELTNLKPNTPYRVQVQVETENGLSAKNIILKFTTKAEGDKSVSRAVPGQPPLAQIVNRPGTQEGSEVKLPTLPQPKTATTSRTDKVEVQHKGLYTPRPPETSRGHRPQPKKQGAQKEKNTGPAPLAQPLPPVSSQQGPPPEGTETAVEEFDVVAFAPSDDEKEQ